MDQLPAGTVTFVFTDIEGSTNLLEALGADEYAAVLSLHRRVVREAFASGVEVETQGDAFFYAFARAGDAVAACESVVQALEGTPVRVRVGVHTGEPLLAEEGYVGMDVHRAARIAAAAHGGQVVVSRTTCDLLPKREFVALGEHRLKDLMRPERLYQLGLGEFPPLRSLHRTNLPTPAWPLVGRERELAEVVELVRAGSRVVTLTGPGGSGKTRLAIQAAAELADGFADGTFFVALAAVESADAVPASVASAVGPRSDEDVIGALNSSRVLLVLDNAEHLDDLDRFVSALVANPGPLVLVTSRAPLHVSAEIEFPIEPLASDAAVELFVTRAAALGRRLPRDEAVRRVCARVDNLPLAVELAAARTRVLTPAALLDRLDAALPLLVGGPHDAPDRQRTLRATIEWSYALLDDEERALFRGLAVFRGSFTLEAAAAVAGADVLAVESLVDRNLVKATDEDRFLMLETLREFATSETAPDELRSLALAHANYYAALAEQNAEQSTALAPEIPNLRAALDVLAVENIDRFFALVNAVWLVWTDLGLLREGNRYASLALRLGAEAPDATRVLLLRNASWAAVWLGVFDEALPLAEERVERARLLGEPALIAALGSLVSVRLGNDDVAGARAAAAEALRIARSLDDPRLTVSALNAVVVSDEAAQDYAACVRHSRDVVERYGSWVTAHRRCSTCKTSAKRYYSKAKSTKLKRACAKRSRNSSVRRP